jgi:cation transporter-like permease
MIALFADACPRQDPLLPSLYNNLCDNTGTVKIQNIGQIPIVIANIIQILLVLIAALAVVFVIYAGIQYITSSGDPAKTATAKATITNAAVGIILSGAAYLLVDYLSRQFQ